MNTKIWIGVLMPCAGFLFLAYAGYAVRQGKIRMSGRYSGGEHLVRDEHPFAFWYEAALYTFYGLFALSPLLHPRGLNGWIASLQGVLAHADQLLMLWGGLLIAYAVYQTATGVSYGRHYQRIVREQSRARFWMNVSRFFVFGLLLAGTGLIGLETLFSLLPIDNRAGFM